MKRIVPGTAWRVRGYRDGQIAHSRVYQRRHDAQRNYTRCLDYYERVTVEEARTLIWELSQDTEPGERWW